jgi:hypothetical protein
MAADSFFRDALIFSQRANSPVIAGFIWELRLRFFLAASSSTLVDTTCWQGLNVVAEAFSLFHTAIACYQSSGFDSCSRRLLACFPSLHKDAHGLLRRVRHLAHQAGPFVDGPPTSSTDAFPPHGSFKALGAPLDFLLPPIHFPTSSPQASAISFTSLTGGAASLADLAASLRSAALCPDGDSAAAVSNQLSKVASFVYGERSSDCSSATDSES